jgi:hypothetical protein
MPKLPYLEAEFKKDGSIFKPKSADVIQFVKQKKLTDLFVISHGWNNDMKEARDLYAKLMDLLAGEVQNNSLFQNRSFGVLGVLWPSKKFTEEELIAGGGAASASTKSEKEKLLDSLKSLKNSFDKTGSAVILADATKAAKKLDSDTDEAAKVFVAQMAKLISGVKGKIAEPDGKVAREFHKEGAKALLNRLQDNIRQSAPRAKNSGGAASLSGAAGGMGGTFNGLFEGARNLLNYVTYYQMKERAGAVGKTGLTPVLKELKKNYPDLKLHLIGHSFGARLVTSAASNVGKGAIDTLVLLQAAFSHYGFAQNYAGGSDGLFRAAITSQKVKGPVLITHTHNDSAVGTAYALASRIARQAGSALGGASDLYGGMGANGAQLTPEANNDFILSSQSKYNFKPGKIYNLKADGCIGDHSDICKKEVASAVARAIQ